MKFGVMSIIHVNFGVMSMINAYLVPPFFSEAGKHAEINITELIESLTHNTYLREHFFHKIGIETYNNIL